MRAIYPSRSFHPRGGRYGVGLIVAFFAAVKFQSGQPALLYLVPACLGASLLTALLRGELGALLAFEDTKIVVPAEQEKEKEKTAN